MKKRENLCALCHGQVLESDYCDIEFQTKAFTSNQLFKEFILNIYKLVIIIVVIMIGVVCMKM